MILQSSKMPKYRDYLLTRFKVKYDMHNNTNNENISITLTTTITATKLLVTSK